MENNNDNNLFTNMFGIESEEEPQEQPIQQPAPEQPQTMEQPMMNQTMMPQQPMMNQGIPQQPEMQPQMNQPTQPQAQEVIVLDSTPSSIPQQEVGQPSFQNTPSQMDYNIPSINTIPTNEEFTGFDEGTQNFKGVYIAFGVILAILIIGFPLYSVIDNVLHPVPNANIGNGNNNEEERPTTTVTEKEPEKPKEEIKPIIFDTTLNFDKGYTTNNDELYQTTAFKPTSTEGVIKCENIKAYKTSTYLEKGIVYIYYRDSRAKKVIISSNQQYNSSSAYNNGIASYAVLKQQIEANKNTEVLIKTSQKDKLIQANILIDMAYGKTLKFDGTNLNYYVVFSYDAPINDAMNKILNNQVNRGNMACSTIVSTDASI